MSMKMRHHLTLKCVVAFTMIFSFGQGHAASHGAKATVQLPAQLVGTWESDEGWSGPFTLNIKAGKVGTFRGTLRFGGRDSACPWDAPFEGRSEAEKITITTDLGGSCGTVAITATFSKGRMTGRYDAEKPDTGSIDAKEKR